jgi:hypothetical protein
LFLAPIYKQSQSSRSKTPRPILPSPSPPQVTSLLLGADLLTGGNLMHLPGSVGAFVWGGIVLPTVYVVTAAVNGFLWKDALVLKVGSRLVVVGCEGAHCCWV